MQGEEVEQQHFLALGQAADNGTEQQQSKHKAHFAELVAIGKEICGPPRLQILLTETL
jgi:hypothetical protein